MDAIAHIIDTVGHTELPGAPPLRVTASPRHDSIAASPANELGMWLSALGAFFNTRNHPLTEAERMEILRRDFASEMRIVQMTLLRISQLLLALKYGETKTLLGGLDDADASAIDSIGEASLYTDASDPSLSALAEAVGDASAVIKPLLQAPAVGFDAWSSFGRVMMREFDRSQAARRITHDARQAFAAALPPPLVLICEQLEPDALGADMLSVFTVLVRILEYLQLIEDLLRRDHPLKQTLPIFTLVHEEARLLLDTIEARALRTEGLETAIFDTLDGTAYAVGMELRKTYERELAGLSALRQAPAIYAKVENAHGLLRDSFQQSTVALAQIFDPSLSGAALFRNFRTKLDQSLALRGDLWTLLQLVQRAERERDRLPVAPLIERLVKFREGSLRYLMYKDWETYERFVEEVSAAQGAVELAPVLHRFGAYLETLFGQINMRAALAEHPFTYPKAEAT